MKRLHDLSNEVYQFTVNIRAGAEHFCTIWVEPYDVSVFKVTGDTVESALSAVEEKVHKKNRSTYGKEVE
jgi:hypothetical protein